MALDKLPNYGWEEDVSQPSSGDITSAADQ